jgi:hypothetical protein
VSADPLSWLLSTEITKAVLGGGPDVCKVPACGQQASRMLAATPRKNGAHGLDHRIETLTVQRPRPAGDVASAGVRNDNALPLA